MLLVLDYMMYYHVLHDHINMPDMELDCNHSSCCLTACVVDGCCCPHTLLLGDVHTGSAGTA